MLSKILSGAAGAAAPRLALAQDGGAAPPGGANDAGGQAGRDARRIAELEQQIERRGAGSPARPATAKAKPPGGRQAAAELQPVLDKLARGIQEIAGLRPQAMRDATADLVELSLGIARRILHRELSVDPAAWRAW
jgi:flagellar biosynthesis/type III secretory pathway protein FliH